MENDLKKQVKDKETQVTKIVKERDVVQQQEEVTTENKKKQLQTEAHREEMTRQILQSEFDLKKQKM